MGKYKEIFFITKEKDIILGEASFHSAEAEISTQVACKEIHKQLYRQSCLGNGILKRKKKERKIKIPAYLHIRIISDLYI